MASGGEPGLQACAFDGSICAGQVASTPLYSGSSLTLLQALAQHFLWFTAHPGTSKQALSEVLHMEHHTLLPPDNVLPDSYTSAMKVIGLFLYSQ